ncbi:MAG: TetM/TetW/TetO/TetS family tetracycline resistance ribosomal protection protein [Lachnospiraceae bacterium]|nr:TetM/TetW/TetO/TetS family tetracycline resistance ribosomal protection protein [Lachnospiraceae bacterium]
MKAQYYSLALLAHVDAGKTTLSESILLNTGRIRQAGRVDHGTSYLDTESEERERGITIFSKQALFDIGEKHFTLIDTPGHVDFSAEMERVLSVLDAAVLIISAPDGIHGHDLTLWKLLETYRIPVFLFINKMDQPGAEAGRVLAELEARFGAGFVDFTGFGDPEGRQRILEEAAMLDEDVLENYLETGEIGNGSLSQMLSERKLFPCLFGSALKNEGVDSLLEVTGALVPEREMPEEFGARVFKITRDGKGKRLTHIRITGGVLRPRDVIRVNRRGTEGPVMEKVSRIVLFSGQKAEQPEMAAAGMVVAVEGLESAGAGDTLGAETFFGETLMVPLFEAGVLPEDGTDIHRLYLQMKELEEEIPEISVRYRENAGEISLRLMGEVQTDIIRALVRERYGIGIRFTQASIVYKETVAAPVIGAGHFEPLRHYAEVHLLIEPAERGSGIELGSTMSEDVLPGHFQRLILTNLGEKKHLGVLTGSELTDVRITLINAKAHEKHTEGGDFREAVYRAVRNGLMKSAARGQAVLLEPYYSFVLCVPEGSVGRAMTDLGRIAESFSGPDMQGGEVYFEGRGAVSMLQGYAAEVLAYTGGFGSFQVSFGGYGPCLNQEEAVADLAYDPELDLENQSGSVFCAHGAGYYIPWNEADPYFHLDLRSEEAWLAGRQNGKDSDPAEGKRTGDHRPENDNYLDYKKKSDEATVNNSNINDKNRKNKDGRGQDLLGAGLRADRELEEIFLRSLGANRGKNTSAESGWQAKRGRTAVDRTEKPAGDSTKPGSLKEPKKQYLLVDGYNIIFAWEELRELAAVNIDAARAALQDILANYQGFRGMTLILVFDAYKVRGGRGSVEKYHNIYVVYTMEAQTADAYIEKTVHELARRERVTVATSDGLEQTIVFGEGAVRMSAAELYEEVRAANADIVRDFLGKKIRLENRLNLS